jgi:glucoamylase
MGFNAMTIKNCPFTPEDINAIKNNLLNNIATPSHALTKVTTGATIEAMPGAVIASPSLPGNTFSQDYFFYWVRDGAIVINEIAALYKTATDPHEKNKFKEILLCYLNFVKKVQSQPELNSIDILGEPKFNVDGTLWTGVWSRPQNDGAAYQALTLTHIANIFLQEGNKQFVIDNIYNPQSFASILKANLEYTAANWQANTIGPWEELFGLHFSVQIVQRRALLEGAALATQLGDTGATSYYQTQAQHIGNALNMHWNDSLGYFSETLAAQDQRGGGINTSVLIALLYGQIKQANDDFALTSEEVISTAYYARYAFEGLYQINTRNKALGIAGSLVGRYCSDVYDGNHSIYGNSWFLCTNMLAAFYYGLAQQLLEGNSISVSFLVKQFLQQVAPAIDIAIGAKLSKASPCFKALIETLITQGDDILQVIKACSVTYKDGSALHMSEQIDRASGKQISAQDLSWSYATLLTAVRLRAETVKLLAAA